MMCVILGCIAQVCLLAVVLYESPAIVQFPVSTAGGLLLWVVCAVYPSYLWGSLCPVHLVVCV